MAMIKNYQGPWRNPEIHAVRVHRVRINPLTVGNSHQYFTSRNLYWPSFSTVSQCFFAWLHEYTKTPWKLDGLEPHFKVQLRRHVDSPKITCGEEALAAWVSCFEEWTLDAGRWRWGMSTEESHGFNMWYYPIETKQGGGFKYVLLSTLPEMIQLDKYFSDGWFNHQLVMFQWMLSSLGCSKYVGNISSQWIRRIFTWGGNRTQCWPFPPCQRQVVLDVIDVDCGYGFKVATCNNAPRQQSCLSLLKKTGKSTTVLVQLRKLDDVLLLGFLVSLDSILAGATSQAINCAASEAQTSSSPALHLTTKPYITRARRLPPPSPQIAATYK